MQLSLKEKSFTLKMSGLLFILADLVLIYYGIAYSIIGGNLKFNYFITRGIISFILGMYLCQRAC